MAHSSGEKTEEATPKSLRDARRRGDVPRSQDLTSALLLMVAIVVLWVVGPRIGAWLSESLQESLNFAAAFKGQLDRETALAALVSATKVLSLVLLPLFAILFVIALLSGYLQVGPIMAFEAIKPNFAKINPGENFQSKFFKSRPYIELGKTLVKIIVTGFVIATVLYAARQDLVELTHQPTPLVASFTLTLIFEIGLKVGLAFLLVGIGDFFLQRFLYMREKRMTKVDWMRDMKESEGNPEQKGLRKQLFQEISMQSMLAAVPRADAVLANPTHVAVALRYDADEMGAPTVVAKGAELMAAQIRQIAEESKVPVVRDVALARALYELDIDQEIPAELFEAVAVVLRFVYEMNGKGKKGN
ncbi:MAG TPA: EscU/YscU/HrcU family type III secretion system export apparatus switch protein [Pyrinomonadaceae bacterium]|jgi:flagellar biosynthesis protein FlhB